MTIDDLKSFYCVTKDCDLSAKLKVSKSTISKWRSKGIPIERQAVIQIKTDGGLVANLQQQEATA